MGVTKSHKFTEEQNRLAGLFKALAHPARIAILEHLKQVNACICNDIVTEIALAQPTISQHLKELKNAGLIKGEIEGNAICYCLNELAFKDLEKYLMFFQNQSCCEIENR